MSKSFDTNKLEKEILKQVRTDIKNTYSKKSFDIQCPKCNQSFSAKKGFNICPNCKNEVNLELDFDF